MLIIIQNAYIILEKFFFLVITYVMLILNIV